MAGRGHRVLPRYYGTQPTSRNHSRWSQANVWSRSRCHRSCLGSEDAHGVPLQQHRKRKLLPALRHHDRHGQVQGLRKALWRRDHLKRRNTTYQGDVAMHLAEHPAAVAQAHQDERPEGLHAEARVHLAHHLLRAAARHGSQECIRTPHGRCTHQLVTWPPQTT